MEQALALNQLDLDDYELLPTLTAKAGYADRSEFSASNSKELDGPPPSGAFSYSGDRTSFTGNLTLSWNVLDFGVSYFNARQNADRSLIADERRKKVLNKHARTNVCFDVEECEPDYENKQGRVVSWESLVVLISYHELAQ